MSEIKIKNKYIFFKLSKNKVSKIIGSNTKKELNDKIKGKSISTDSDILLMIIEKKDDFSLTSKNINSLGGPIKITFQFYELSSRGNLKKKKEDPRAIQLVYYTYDYYIKNKIKSADLVKLATLAFQNKLEKRLLAPKLITQILLV